MSSSAGPSRVSRPRRSSGATSNGSTASSTGTGDGARTGACVGIFVSGDCETMALYLGSERAELKGVIHVPDAAQRATLLRRAGTHSLCMDPGSAAHHHSASKTRVNALLVL